MADSEEINEFGKVPDCQKVADRLLQSAADAKPMNAASFDATTPIGGKMLVQATLLPCIPLKEMINKTIHLSHWMAHVAGTTDDQGEFDEFTRIVLFDDKGVAYQCAARGILKSLAVFCFARNSLAFDPPIKCEVKLQDLKGGKQWLSLIPDLTSIGANSVKRK